MTVAFPSSNRLGLGAAIIMDAVTLFETSHDVIFSASRKPCISKVRWAICWTLHKALGWSQSRIARQLNWTNHTSVGHALTRANEVRQRDPLFATLTNTMLLAHQARIRNLEAAS
jgi:chromosomal replication initiation ATPase DnaA